jgi:hypothetical protein
MGHHSTLPIAGSVPADEGQIVAVLYAKSARDDFPGTSYRFAG